MFRVCLSLGGIIALITTLCLTLSRQERPASSTSEISHQLERAAWTCTFSIVAFDPDHKEWGVAVASKYLAVGAVVPWAKAGLGAVATQSYVNVTYGPRGLELLALGKSAEEVVKLLTDADKEKDFRQVGIVDAKGNVASFTGVKCLAWAGHKSGKHYTCQGNILAGEEVVKAMAQTFE